VIKPGLAAISVLFVLTFAAVGCSPQPAPAAAVPAAQPGSQAMPAAVPAGVDGTVPPEVETVTGEVLETMDASTYTYMRVKTAKGDLWAATARTPVKVGEKVTVPLESEMRDFHSATLNRDFPLIYFVTQITRDGQPAPPPLAVAHGMAGGAMASQPAAPLTVKPMAPPSGGSSIADVWARRAALAGKTVTVNGTVVKFNGGILGRNWIHLQDGSGKAADGTNDITVTSDTAVKVGDVITATGKVVVDKDFGSGYAYKVLLEDGKIK
jgi:hypothetical protein